MLHKLLYREMLHKLLYTQALGNMYGGEFCWNNLELYMCLWRSVCKVWISVVGCLSLFSSAYSNYTLFYSFRVFRDTSSLQRVRRLNDFPDILGHDNEYCRNPGAPAHQNWCAWAPGCPLLSQAFKTSDQCL